MKKNKLNTNSNFQLVILRFILSILSIPFIFIMVIIISTPFIYLLKIEDMPSTYTFIEILIILMFLSDIVRDNFLVKNLILKVYLNRFLKTILFIVVYVVMLSIVDFFPSILQIEDKDVLDCAIMTISIIAFFLLCFAENKGNRAKII